MFVLCSSIWFLKFAVNFSSTEIEKENVLTFLMSVFVMQKNLTASKLFQNPNFSRPLPTSNIIHVPYPKYINLNHNKHQSKYQASSPITP